MGAEADAMGGTPSMERLSGLDTGFYFCDSPGMHLHIGAILVFSKEGLAGGDPMRATEARVESRIGKMPRFTQRVAEVPFGLAEPYWVDDEDFRLERHLRLAGEDRIVPAQELVSMAAAIISVPLDKAHALWEITVVPNVEGDRFALLAKIHHVLLDGVLGIEVLANLFDLTPQVGEEESLNQSVPPVSEPPGLADILRDMGDSVLGKLRDAPGELGRLGALARDWFGFVNQDGASWNLRTVFEAPRTPINGSLCEQRTTAVVPLGMAEVESLAAKAGVRLNDVVMWLVSTALGRYLEERGWRPDKDLVAMMPMAHANRSRDAGSNQVTALLVSLRNSVEDPMERLRAITEATGAAKRFHRESSLAEFAELTRYIPPWLTWAAARALYEARAFEFIPPLFNLLVTTVRGIDFPLYFAGSELIEVVPFGPLADSAGLNVTAVSYNGTLQIGVVGEPRLVPDPERLAFLLAEVLEELGSVLAG